MQLNITTDYAIRIILQLATTNRITTSKEISDAMHVPPNYLPNIVKKLREGGLVEAMYGPMGGYRLAKPSSEISLLNIISLMEGKIKINRCLEDDGFCDRKAVNCCSVHDVYVECQQNIEDCFEKYKVDQLLARAEARKTSAPKASKRTSKKKA